MYTIATDTFLQFIQTVWSLIQGTLRLDPQVFQAVLYNSQTDWPIFVIVFLAGVSLTLGQSVTLLINKVTRTRFAISLLISGLIFVLSVFVQAVTIWLIANFGFATNIPLSECLRTVSLSYAPLILSFFVLLPYAGSLIDHMLDIWRLLATIVAISVLTRLELWQVLVCTLGGWLALQIIKFTIGRPIIGIVRWIRYRAAGVPLKLTVHDFTESVLQDVKDPSVGR